MNPRNIYMTRWMLMPLALWLVAIIGLEWGGHNPGIWFTASGLAATLLVGYVAGRRYDTSHRSAD